MIKSINEEMVVCPFYKRNTVQTITCEGLVDKTTVTHGFADRAAKASHFDAHCCQLPGWERCPYAAELLYRYGEE